MIRLFARSSFLQVTCSWRVPACLVITVAVACGMPRQAVAQTPAPPAAVPAVAGILSDGWAALAAGDLAKAQRAADRAMAEAPLSAAAVSLAVEIDVTRGTSLAGLEPYERWLAGRKVDDPYVLRRIAQTHLRRVARDQQHLGRAEAAKALAADGDQAALADLMRGAAAGGDADAKMLAAAGDPRGVEILIGQLRAPGGGGKLSAINALVQSGSRLAVPALIDVLGDRREDHRAAAADALGRLAATEAIPKIKPLLNDPVFPVRLAAAAALYRLEDYSGLDLIQQLMSSEHASVRLSAAEVMAVRPGPEWLGVVRQLATERDETVRLGAARLLAPYDRELATETLQGLSASENPAVREEAGRIYVGRVASDFAALRAQLRNREGLTAVRAAERILELTRR